MECYTYLRNVTDLLSDWKMSHERRFGQPFKGPIIPFDSLVEYHPITAKDQSRIHQFGKKVLPGLFLGQAGEFGRVTYWSQTMRSWRRWTHWKSVQKDSTRKRWCFPKKENSLFQSQMDESKLPGEDQDLRTPTLIRHWSIQGESNIDFLEELEGSLPQPHDSVAGEVVNDFWSMSGNFIYRHHVEPRVKLLSPREESFPIPFKHIDVSRTTHTTLDVKQEKRIDDYWNVDGQETCLIFGQWSHCLLYQKKKVLTDMHGPERDWRGNSGNPGQIIHDQNSGSQWKECQAEGETQVVKWKAPFWKHTKKTRDLFHRPWGQEVQRDRQKMRIRSWKRQSLLLCRAKLWKRIVGVVHRTKLKQNLRVFWKWMNLRDCVWENHHQIIMKITLQEKDTIHYSITIWFTNVFLCLKLWKFLQQKQR